MSRGVNKAIIVGNLGNDPEVRYAPSGDAIANFSVATSEEWKDKQTGEKQERTEWHRIVAFKKLGEICGEYLKKGSKVYIEGSIRTRKWQAQDGSDRYSTEIVASDMQMLDSRGDSLANGRHGEGYQGRSEPQAAQAEPQKGSFDNFDDDIPFKESVMSQTDQIKKHLNRGWKITPVQALEKYGCFRLGARIYDLKQSGMNIETRIIEKNGKRFAEYRRAA